MRGLRRAIGPAHFRRLRDRDQHRGLAERKAPRLLAEIGERCGARAFEIAAVGREAEIEREDLVLGQRALELHRAHRLAQLGEEGAVGARLEQPRDLHGDGRAARHDAAVRDELHGSARDRERIDADVLAEALVLVGDQQVEIARIDVGHGRGQPPAAVRRRVGPQQAAVAVDHDGGELERFAERHRAEGMDPGAEGGGAMTPAALRVQRAQAAPQLGRSLPLGGRGREGAMATAVHTRAATPTSPQGGGDTELRLDAFAHFAASISTEPTPVRPKRSGRYMSSM